MQLRKTFQYIGLLLIVLLLTACSGGSKKPLTSAYDNSDRVLKQALYQHYKEWESIPYRLGGLSKTGVDCSGFVYLTFANKFGMRLPRTSEQQAQIGRAIPQHQLKPGDLVFFITGPKQKHVGIYIEQRRFLHASTTKGVAISSLDNPYWSGRYWKSVRVLYS
ncbi:MAG: NlpC/P60 family protein [Methylomicrobium sp.]